MSQIPEDVMQLAKEAHARFADSRVTDNLTDIIARAILSDRSSRSIAETGESETTPETRLKGPDDSQSYPRSVALSDLDDARKWLRARWCVEHPNEGHVKQLAEYAAGIRAPAPQTLSGGSFIQSLSPNQLRIHEALCDSQYIAGLKAGWNAGCIQDPAEAQAKFVALIKSREGHLEGYAKARAALATEAKDNG